MVYIWVGMEVKVRGWYTCPMINSEPIPVLVEVLRLVDVWAKSAMVSCYRNCSIPQLPCIDRRTLRHDRPLTILPILYEYRHRVRSIISYIPLAPDTFEWHRKRVSIRRKSYGLGYIVHHLNGSGPPGLSCSSYHYIRNIMSFNLLDWVMMLGIHEGDGSEGYFSPRCSPVSVILNHPFRPLHCYFISYYSVLSLSLSLFADIPLHIQTRSVPN